MYLFLFFIYILLSALIFYKNYDIINYKIKRRGGNMKVYRVTRKIEAFEVDENDLLNHIKECDYSNDEDIQNAESMKELIENFGSLSDFECEAEYFCDDKNLIGGRPMIQSLLYEDDFDTAYDIMEWGVH